MLIIELFGGVVCLLFAAFLLSTKRSDTRLADAEAYIRNHTELYRHYNIRAVQDILRGKMGRQGHIADITDDEAISIIARIRSEKGLGPIPYDRLP